MIRWRRGQFSKTALESNFRPIGPEFLYHHDKSETTFTSIVVVDVIVVLITIAESVLNDIVKMSWHDFLKNS